MKSPENPCDLRKVCKECLIYSCCTEACDKLVESLFATCDNLYQSNLRNERSYRKFLMERLKQ